MKKILAIAILTMSSLSLAEARVSRVSSYYKPSTGQYVYSHYRTTPNTTKVDNFSTKGNYNPYTGKNGTKNAW
jgi:hypothetical protein